MFENVGRKVQTLAKVICWLGIIASVISGIAIWVAGGASSSYSSYSYYGRTSGGSTFLIGLLTIVIGSFVAWVGSLTTYAIGEAAEYAELNNKKLVDLERKLKESKPVENSSEHIPSNPAPRAYGGSKIGDTWRCSKCGSTNSGTAQFCKDCGTYR